MLLVLVLEDRVMRGRGYLFVAIENAEATTGDVVVVEDVLVILVEKGSGRTIEVDAAGVGSVADPKVDTMVDVEADTNVIDGRKSIVLDRDVVGGTIFVMVA